MASVLNKFNTLISASVHGLLDRALRNNSLRVIDEYLRDAERNLTDLEDTAATIGGTVKSLRRKYDEYTAQIEKLDHDIDTLLRKGKNELAVAAQTDLNNKQKIAEEYRQRLAQQEEEYQQLLNSRRKLEHRLVLIRQQREQLRALIELTEAKKVTTRTMRSLDDLSDSSDDDIRRMSENILFELDRAEAESEIAAGRLQNEVEEAVGQSQIEAQLEERRRRLGMDDE
jgi:phage shock protein A